jgi:hypothetical protein
MGDSPKAVPADIGARIERLRKVLAEATDFATIWALFDQTLAVNDAFMQMGVRTKDQELDLTIETAVASVISNPGRRLETETIRIASHRFLHGFAMFESAMCTFFYFQGDDQGLIIGKKSLVDPQVHYLRFSRFETTGHAFPMRKVKGPPQ